MNVTEPLAVPNTGGWRQWQTITKIHHALPQARGTWRIVFDTNGPTTAVGNLNFIRILETAPAVPCRSDEPDGVGNLEHADQPGVDRQRNRRGRIPDRAIERGGNIYLDRVVGPNVTTYSNTGLTPGTSLSLPLARPTRTAFRLHRTW